MVRPGFAVTAATPQTSDHLPAPGRAAAGHRAGCIAGQLLAPGALLARLGQSLSLAAGDSAAQRASRPCGHHRWSYDLLTSDLRMIAACGVFVGGCDLDALARSPWQTRPGAELDPLLQVAELLDVSLITVTDGADGEPRVGILETIREYASSDSTGR